MSQSQSQTDATADAPAARRERLPDTRNSITHKFSISGHEGYVTVGLYDDGRPGELFLTVAKQGSTVRGLMHTIGILSSMALQYGVPVEVLARKFEHFRFEPSGWSPNDQIQNPTSIVDYVFRWLGLQFSDEYRRSYEPALPTDGTDHTMQYPDK